MSNRKEAREWAKEKNKQQKIKENKMIEEQKTYELIKSFIFAKTAVTNLHEHLENAIKKTEEALKACKGEAGEDNLKECLHNLKEMEKPFPTMEAVLYAHSFAHFNNNIKQGVLK